MGRPSSYTSEVALAICTRLVDGESLRAICLSEDMPDRGTVFRWLETYEEFRSQYARAREAQADTLADEITHIADTPQIGVVRKITDDGVEVTEEDMLGHRRLQIDARKWIAAKLKPKKYGEKLAIGGGDDPIKVNSHVTHASAAALQRVGELLTRATTIGSPGEDSAPHPNGSVLPTTVRSDANGHGTPVAPSQDQGSSE